MSKIASLILAAVTVSLIFISGCKEKPAQAAEPKKGEPVNSQPVEPLAVVVPEIPVPVIEVKTETPVIPVASVVTKIDDKPKEGGHGVAHTKIDPAIAQVAGTGSALFPDPVAVAEHGEGSPHAAEHRDGPGESPALESLGSRHEGSLQDGSCSGP